MAGQLVQMESVLRVQKPELFRSPFSSLSLGSSATDIAKLDTIRIQADIRWSVILVPKRNDIAIHDLRYSSHDCQIIKANKLSKWSDTIAPAAK